MPKISKEEYERKFAELSAKLDHPDVVNRVEAAIGARIDRDIRLETRSRNLAHKQKRKLNIIGSSSSPRPSAHA